MKKALCKLVCVAVLVSSVTFSIPSTSTKALALNTRYSGKGIYKTKEVIRSIDNLRKVTYDKNGRKIKTTYSWGNTSNHPTINYREAAYEGCSGVWRGTLKKYAFTEIPSVTQYLSDGGKIVTTRFVGEYRGIVTFYPEPI